MARVLDGGGDGFAAQRRRPEGIRGRIGRVGRWIGKVEREKGIFGGFWDNLLRSIN